ncbi:thioredoxin domain-containing protein [Aeoliella mucimassa]|uniref:Thioredoxin domain-containing protein n=1 Tax=Aeoliella mucimassa TaxID=2527972 RepID=A0A518ATL0_9BACT|nr:hypothetical protein [Aeoliella mucimassa]QDU58037.1 hypothetical protein Pan181_42630 [Aeoliella mucimassa]
MLHYFALVTVAFGLSANEPAAPQWSSDYAEALKQTRSDDRPMLVVIDEPGTAEHSLNEEILNNMADGALADYQLCHIDATTKYGKKVAEAFKTTSFPYMAITDKDGKVIVHSQSGDVSAEQWSEVLGKFRTGELPVRRVVAKPVINEQPVTTYPTYEGYPSYGSAKPYCAKCQRGY